ncbi:MAG: hypothetical protein PHE58_07515, partial [Candidatus Omnitrophica bacterium]|nr:hypothetical protein [Candidatus Omnitrophota bacterium]
MRKNVYWASMFLTVLIGTVCLSLPVWAGSFGSSAAGSGKTISASSSGSTGGSWGKVNMQAKPSLSEKKSAPNMKAVTVSSSSVNIDLSVQGLVDDFNWAKDAILGSGKPVQGQSVSVVNPRIGSDLDGWSLTYPEQTLPENMQMFTANNVQLKSQASAGDIRIKNQGGTEGWVSRSDVWAYVVTSAGARTGNGEGGDGKYALVRTDNIGVGKESQLFIPSRGTYREDNNNKVDSRSTTQYRTMTANPSGTGDILTASYKDAFVVGKVDINSDGRVKTLNSVLVREDKMNSGGDLTR